MVFMIKDIKTSNLTKIIVIFPLISLLLYGAFSYFTISYTQHEEAKKKFKKFVEIHEVAERGYLKERVVNILDFINYYDDRVTKHLKETTNIDNKSIKKLIEPDIIGYLKHEEKFQNGYIFISDSNKKIIFEPDVDFMDEATIHNSEGYSEDKNFLIYTGYIPKYDWYIHAVENFEMMYESINKRRDRLQKKNSENIKRSLSILTIVGIISILLSLYLSRVINKILKSYEEEIKQTNQKLIFQSRQALIGELFSMIAHQWRQPINKIASIIALLKFNVFSKNIDPQKVDEKYNKIEDNIEFMSETIEDFRTFYLPSSKIEEANLKELILKSIDFLDGSIRKKNIKITKSLQNITIKLHPNEFLQVMLNLIKNAIDAIETNGEITITLKQKNKQTIISVEDNGKGVSTEDINKVFNPYYSTKKESMGLGLYMTKLIIENHMQGTISIERLPDGVRFLIVV